MVDQRYLLDTNIFSQLIKRPNGLLAERVSEMDSETYCTSLIVACELRYGAAKKGSAQLSDKVEQLLGVVDVLPLNPGVDHCYARLRALLEREGRPIGANDLLIAAHALSLGHIVVTANIREFSQVPDLRVENWLAEPG